MITFRMTTVLARIPAPAALAVRPDGARCSGVAVALTSSLIRAIDKFYKSTSQCLSNPIPVCPRHNYGTVKVAGAQYLSTAPAELLWCANDHVRWFNQRGQLSAAFGELRPYRRLNCLPS